MKITQDATFRAERKRYRLRFTCEDCVHFDPEQPGCAQAYPTDPHRTAYYRSRSVPLVFCKDFDLR
jgi:hypothetical protein